MEKSDAIKDLLKHAIIMSLVMGAIYIFAANPSIRSLIFRLAVVTVGGEFYTESQLKNR